MLSSCKYFTGKKEKQMKKTMKLVVMGMLCLMILGMAGCSKEEVADLWADAVYTEDAEFGEGEKTVQVEVEMEGKSVTFTVNTDKEILGDLLLEHKIIEGEEGPYGLYIKSVNGVQADYDVDQAYWAVYQDGEYLMTGVDLTEVSDGEHYEFVYTKE